MVDIRSSFLRSYRAGKAGVMEMGGLEGSDRVEHIVLQC